MKDGVIMQALSFTYKIEIAENLTQLAIQHNLIKEHSDAEETAIEVCKFYQTIVEKLDANLNE